MYCYLFFFFKQKTAYEMRISDWSSDVCSSDLDRVAIRADEGDAVLFEGSGELAVLRQEAIARMHRLGAGLLAGRDDLLDDQVALGGSRRADMHGLVGHAHVQGTIVGIGIDRHRPDAKLAAGLDDAAGDFAAIGNQDLLEQLLGHDALYLHSGMLSCFFHGFPASCRAAWRASGQSGSACCAA